MSLADILRKKQSERKKDNSRVNDLAIIRARMAKLKREEEEKAIEAERIRKEELEAARIARELARAEAERKHKTNDYFDFDRQFRKIVPPGSPRYYGDNIKKLDTWVPHGDGDIYFEGKKVYSGNYEKGIMHGTGTLWNPDGSIWEGEFKMGKMHGVGLYTSASVGGKEGTKEEALMRDNILHCLKKDLQDGTQVEIYDTSMRIGNNASPRVTIQFHQKKWSYRCRFHDEVIPRERNVDFSALKHFKILHHLPKVYDLSRFGICTDKEDAYNYWSDTFKSGTRPYLGVAGGRYTAENRPLNAALVPIEDRATSVYDENMFESREMGIGLSLVDLEQKRFAEKKRREWDALVAKKREEEDKSKAAHVEEEQARLLAEAAEAQQEKQRLKHLEDAETAARMAEEAARWDAAGPSAGVPAPQIQIRDRKRSGMTVDKEEAPSTGIIAESTKDAAPSNRPRHAPMLSRKLSTTEITSHMNSGSGSVWNISRSMSQSYLHKKAVRTLSRIESRYKKERDQDLADQGFETGNLLILAAYVQFKGSDDEDDIPLFQAIASYLTIALDASGSDLVRALSVMPLEDEDKRTYEWGRKDLKSISIRVTADTLELSTVDVNVMEEVKGRKDVSLGMATFNFDAMKKEIGSEVDYELQLNDKHTSEHKGVVRLKMKIEDTTVYAD